MKKHYLETLLDFNDRKHEIAIKEKDETIKLLASIINKQTPSTMKKVTFKKGVYGSSKHEVFYMTYEHPTATKNYFYNKPEELAYQVNYHLKHGFTVVIEN